MTASAGSFESPAVTKVADVQPLGRITQTTTAHFAMHRVTPAVGEAPSTTPLSSASACGLQTRVVSCMRNRQFKRPCNRATPSPTALARRVACAAPRTTVDAVTVCDRTSPSASGRAMATARRGRASGTSLMVAAAFALLVTSVRVSAQLSLCPSNWTYYYDSAGVEGHDSCVWLSNVTATWSQGLANCR